MCDERQLARWARSTVSRRAFGGGALATAREPPESQKNGI